MKTIEVIQEDDAGNVVGAYTSTGFVKVSDPFPRAELATKAAGMALKDQLEVPAEALAKIPGTTPK